MLRHLVGIGSLLSLCLGYASAQSGTATLFGDVTDPAGAVVAAAKIELLSEQTSVARRTVSDASGSYQFVAVPSGRYRLSVQTKGFRPANTAVFELLINTKTRQDLSLQIDQVRQVIQVSAIGNRLNAGDGSIGNVLTSQQVMSLPLEGNQPAALLVLQPGVNFTGRFVDRRSGAVSGARGDQTSITVDGTDANDQEEQRVLLGAAVPIPLESIQEFRFTTSNPALDQGRSSGGQIALVTKSGTNHLHGSVFWNHRNSATSANEWFHKADLIALGLPNKTPHSLTNIFGVSLGGPVKRDRLFFFLTYEGTRLRLPGSALSTVPSDSLRQGFAKYRDADGNVITLTPADLQMIDPAGLGVNPAMLSILQSYPPCTDPVGDIDGGLNFCHFRFEYPYKRDKNIYVAKFDFQVTRDGRHAVFWRGTLGNADDDFLGRSFPEQPPVQALLDISKGFSTGYTHQLSPRFLGIFHYGFTRLGQEFTGAKGPALFIALLTPLFSTERGFKRAIPSHNFVEDMTLVRGTHTFQWGANARLTRNHRARFEFPTYGIFGSPCAGSCLSVPQSLGPGGAFPQFPAVSPESLISLRSGLVDLYGMITFVSGTYAFDGQAQRPAGGEGLSRDFVHREFELYFQDIWRATRNLTLTFGLRYSYYGVPYEANGIQSSPTADIREWFARRISAQAAGLPSASLPLLTWDLSGAGAGRPGLYSPDKNNFAPGIAFAYAPAPSSRWWARIFGQRKSVLRGGFRVVYDRTGGGLIVTNDANALGLVTPVESPFRTLGYSGPACTTPPTGPCAAPRFSSLSNLPPLTAFTEPPPAGLPYTPPDTFSNVGFVVDNRLRTPYGYMISFAFGRELPGNTTVEAAYVGRMGHKLLAKVDLAAPFVFLRDPASGATWADAINQLYSSSQRGTAPVSAIAPLPYFENLFPGLAGNCSAVPNCTATQGVYEVAHGFFPSFTDSLFALDGLSRLQSPTFFHQQFISLPAWTNFGHSNYHSLQLIVRKAFSHGLLFDFNYTFSKSIDNASEIEALASFVGQIPDGFHPQNNRSVSDFDIKHQITSNFVYQLPIGRGRAIANGLPGVMDHVLGGWSSSGIIRWRTGLPISLFNGPNWPTNYFLEGPGTQICPITTNVLRAIPGGPNLFGTPAQVQAARKCADFTPAGGSGSRNSLRGARLFNMDFALTKSFALPIEGHRLEFRWQAFNLFNNVNLDDRSLHLDPSDPEFGRYTGSIATARVMQFVLRYEF